MTRPDGIGGFHPWALRFMPRRLPLLLGLVLGSLLALLIGNDHLFASALLVSAVPDMISHSPFGTTLWWITLGLIATVVRRRPMEARPSPVRTAGV